MTPDQISPSGEPESPEVRHVDFVIKTLGIMEKLNFIKDVHALLDTVLFQARQLTRADAGSFYLIEPGVLNFSYTQNHTLFDSSGSNKYLYANNTVAIDNRSLVLPQPAYLWLNLVVVA
jgi:hypothetical protein